MKRLILPGICLLLKLNSSSNGEAPTTNDVTLLVLFSLPDVQQQVGAVGVGCVSRPGTHQRLLPQPLVVAAQVQLAHTVDETAEVRGDTMFELLARTSAGEMR